MEGIWADLSRAKNLGGCNLFLGRCPPMDPNFGMPSSRSNGTSNWEPSIGWAMGGAPFSGWTGGQGALLSKRDSLVSSAIVQILTSQSMGREIKKELDQGGWHIQVRRQFGLEEVVEWDNLYRDIHVLPLEDQGKRSLGPWKRPGCTRLGESHISRMCGERGYLPRLRSFYGNSYSVDCHLVSKWLRDEIHLMDFVPCA
jgi:hypothetical protein